MSARFRTMVVVSLFIAAGVGGCAPASNSMTAAPAASGPPVDVPWANIANAQFAKQYVGRRVHTVAQFQGIAPTSGMNMGGSSKYTGNDWVTARFMPCGPADMNALQNTREVHAPMAIAQGWPAEKSGAVYDLTGVLVTNTELAGMEVQHFEIESMNKLDSCPAQ